MQRKHGAAHPAFHVIVEKGARPQVALPLDEYVVDRVVDVDQEAARRDAAGEGDGVGHREIACENDRGRTRGNRRHQMTARTHSNLLTTQSPCPTCQWRR